MFDCSDIPHPPKNKAKRGGRLFGCATASSFATWRTYRATGCLASRLHGLQMSAFCRVSSTPNFALTIESKGEFVSAHTMIVPACAGHNFHNRSRSLCLFPWHQTRLRGLCYFLWEHLKKSMTRTLAWLASHRRAAVRRLVSHVRNVSICSKSGALPTSSMAADENESLYVVGVRREWCRKLSAMCTLAI